MNQTHKFIKFPWFQSSIMHVYSYIIPVFFLFRHFMYPANPHIYVFHVSCKPKMALLYKI
jgi:hypothetical protein